MKRKFQSEFGLHMFNNHSVLLYPKDIQGYEFDQAKKYHIYMIHKISKITIDPNSIKQFSGNISLDLKFQDKTNFETKNIKFCIHPRYNHKIFEVRCEYPYNLLILKWEKEELIINSLFLSGRCEEKLNLEILYIGQSYGKEGERQAIKRLASHSTLQKIISEISIQEPDKDVVVTFWEFIPRIMSSIDGISKRFQKSNEEDDRHIEEVLSYEYGMKQAINITEAALINYFKPKYNDIFKDNFPNVTHTSYKDYYDLDFNRLVVELDSDEGLHAKVYTETNTYGIWNFIKYRLHPENIRRDMLEIFSPAKEEDFDNMI